MILLTNKFGLALPNWLHNSQCEYSKKDIQYSNIQTFNESNYSNWYISKAYLFPFTFSFLVFSNCSELRGQNNKMNFSKSNSILQKA